MEYAIVLYSDRYKTQIGTYFFNGYIENAFNKGEELLNKHSNARYYNIFETDFYFNTLKRAKITLQK